MLSFVNSPIVQSVGIFSAFLPKAKRRTVDIPQSLRRLANSFENNISDSLIKVFRNMKKKIELKQAEEALKRSGIGGVLAMLDDVEDQLYSALHEDLTRADITLLGHSTDKRKMFFTADKYDEVFQKSQKFKNLVGK